MAIFGPHDTFAAKPITAASLDDNPGVLVQTGNTTLWGFSIANGAAATTYVQLFDAAALTDVTLGTTTPDAWIALPASVAVNHPVSTKGLLNFTKGLVAFSTNSATGNTGATTNATFFIS